MNNKLSLVITGAHPLLVTIFFSPVLLLIIILSFNVMWPSVVKICGGGGEGGTLENSLFSMVVYFVYDLTAEQIAVASWSHIICCCQCKLRWLWLNRCGFFHLQQRTLHHH